MFFNKIQKFSRDQKGNLAITFALAMVPLMFSVGATVDYTQINRIQSRLQETADSAALYAIKELRDGGYDEEKVDQFAQDMVASNYNIVSIPTILLFHNGNVAKQQIGAVPKKALEDLVKEYL